MPAICYTAPPWLLKLARSRAEGHTLTLADVPKQALAKFELIQKAVRILEEYSEQGYQLTLRQLYYQFVSRDIIPNTQKDYSRLGDIISDGRMWGMIDWDHIVDRGRNLISNPHWDSPTEIMESCAASFRLDLWLESPIRPEVWVEKQALEEVVSKAAKPLDVSYLACKGYMSQSEMWSAAMRIKRRFEDHGQKTLIIHLGDHDPSGIDMSRDIEDRITQFDIAAECFEVDRIALNMPQIEEHSPPPNPAKETDSRFADYREKFGDESWELDALEPSLIRELITERIEQEVDETYDQRHLDQAKMREQLSDAAENWSDIVQFLEDRK